MFLQPLFARGYLSKLLTGQMLLEHWHQRREYYHKNLLDSTFWLDADDGVHDDILSKCFLTENTVFMSSVCSWYLSHTIKKLVL